jgi:hypothetical protein
MNPTNNRFAPGAGTAPPELAGRVDIRETVRIAMERVRIGRPAKSVLMVGLRGFATIGPLSASEARSAIQKPVEAQKVMINDDALDQSFFRVRFDRLTPQEKKYLRAMTELGPGPHRSGDIAENLQRAVSALGPTRSQLMAKGMVWSPSHGDTAFTVPLFDEFMCRIMPGEACKI